MKHVTLKVPHSVFAGIKNNYPGHRLINIMEEKDQKGMVIYDIDLLYQGKYLHLKMNGSGVISNERTEPEFVNDYHEQYF